MSQKSSAATGILKLQNKNKEDNTMSAMNINKNNFHEEVMNSDKPVLVDFWAPWCGPCRMVVPIVEEIAAEHPEYKVVKVNVDEEVELASQFKVFSIPTLVVVKNGQVVSQSVGAKPKNQILAMLG
jgi:thioredoxin 1